MQTKEEFEKAYTEALEGLEDYSMEDRRRIFSCVEKIERQIMRKQLWFAIRDRYSGAFILPFVIVLVNIFCYPNNFFTYVLYYLLCFLCGWCMGGVYLSFKKYFKSRKNLLHVKKDVLK